MTDSFTCPRCHRASHNPNDVREGYCGACHDWTGNLSVEERLRAEVAALTAGTEPAEFAYRRLFGKWPLS